MADIPLVEVTVGSMPCPEVEYNAASGEFWLTWRSGNIRVDVTIKDRDELRELTRACIEAAETEHAAHHKPIPGKPSVD